MIAGDNENPVGRDAEFFAQRGQEICDLGVLLGLAGLRGIAGEEDEVDAAFFGEQGLQITKPGIAQDPPPAPWLLFFGTLCVEVRDVQELEAVGTERHSPTLLQQLLQRPYNLRPTGRFGGA